MPLPVILSQNGEDEGDGDQAPPPSPPNSRPKKKARNSQDDGLPTTTVKPQKTTKASDKAASKKRKASTLDKENMSLAMSFEEKVEVAKMVDLAALNIAKLHIAKETLAQRGALINVKKTQTELKLAKETRRLQEVELELLRARTEVDDRQQQFELEKLRLMRDTAVAQASTTTQGATYYQPMYIPQPSAAQAMYGPQPSAAQAMYGPQPSTAQAMYGPQPSTAQAMYGPQPFFQNPIFPPQLLTCPLQAPSVPSEPVGVSLSPPAA